MRGRKKGVSLASTGAAVAGGMALAGAALLMSRRRRFDLAGKTVLITGGSRGLGLELARQVRARGARVGLLARAPDELNRAVAQLGKGGVLPLPCDLRDPKETREAASRLAERFGRIDALVNVAGTIRVGPLEDMEAGDFYEQMESNYFSALHATLAALPYLRASGQGRIVNVTSIGGRISVPHLLPYSAAKFALVGLSEGLRAELAPKGIRVTTVTPGLMRTGSPYRAKFKGRQRDEFAWFLLADSLPFLSTSARNAARQIVRAMIRGDASLIVPAYVRIPIAFHGLAPGLTTRLTAIAARLLPSASGHGARPLKGRGGAAVGSGEGEESSDRGAREGRELIPPDEAPAYAALTTRAARRNNELG